MVVTNSFDVVNSPEGLSALNVLLQAGQGGEATLTLRPLDGSEDPFTLAVSEVKLEHDTSSGLVLLDAKTAFGVVTGRLRATPSTGRSVGRIVITSEGPMPCS